MTHASCSSCFPLPPPPQMCMFQTMLEVAAGSQVIPVIPCFLTQRSGGKSIRCVRSFNLHKSNGQSISRHDVRRRDGGRKFLQEHWQRFSSNTGPFNVQTTAPVANISTGLISAGVVCVSIHSLALGKTRLRRTHQCVDSCDIFFLGYHHWF